MIAYRCLFVGIALLLPTFPALLRAELPPSAYEKMQQEAPEVLRVKVLRVEVAENNTDNAQEVSALVQILKVGRSAAKLKPDDLVTIKYQIPRREPGWVGPGPVPLLEQDVERIAYLKPLEGYMEFAPAAGAMSFDRFL